MSVPTQTRSGLKSRRSLHDFEEAFHAEVVRERHRLRDLRKDAKRRSLRRKQQQTRRRGQFRFVALVASMIATAVLVTVVMLETLSWLLG